ncbi:MAG: dihydrofolate reductase [Candidatus Saccharibacteria bacterium]|nr:dihydrofolate reductase [Candidatus Saccharibacteria bacterium]
MSFSIIAAVGRNRELGANGGLVFRIPEDMKFFKETTMGHPVVMGRKTYESIGRELPGRKNIILSRSSGIDVEKFIEENKDSEEEIFVIGGGMIYEKFLPYASTIYLTEVEAEAEADTFFPEFDKNEYTATVLRESSDGGLKFRFVKYTKREEK